MRTIASNSAYGAGGIGQHFAQLVEESRATGHLQRYYAPVVRPKDDYGVRLTIPRWQTALVRYTPLRFTPGWGNYLLNDFFDRTTAAALESPIRTFMGFVGKSLRSFRAARALGADTLELVAANSHVLNVQRLHRLAAAQSGISDSWLNDAQVRKTMREYEQADLIYTHSDYTHNSLLNHGVDPAKLRRTYLRVSPRFRPPDQRTDDGIFRIVYVGRIDATKGIPLLLDAYEQLDLPSKQLTLVGGWSTRSMRLYMERRLAELDEINVAPGDPLPALRAADVFVHPSYEDGFGYAPMEALATGTPVIVTSDTGMKEYVEAGTNGFVVPTGAIEPLVERLYDIYQRPLCSTNSLLPRRRNKRASLSSSSSASY
jgi:glycosyltransferase involved in cell wall biosynthesis